MSEPAYQTFHLQAQRRTPGVQTFILEQTDSASAILRDLASKIATAHSRSEATLRKSVLYAREAGEFLIEAKRHVPVGKWGAWIRKNLPFSHATANLYMRLADNWDRLDSERVKNLSLRKLAKVVSDLDRDDREPEEKDKEPEEEDDPEAPAPAPRHFDKYARLLERVTKRVRAAAEMPEPFREHRDQLRIDHEALREATAAFDALLAEDDG